MAAWTDDELHHIGTAQEVEIAPVRRTGARRRPTPIWIVRLGDDLYIRAAYGANKGWHGVARTSRQARIQGGGIEKNVRVLDEVTAA